MSADKFSGSESSLPASDAYRPTVSFAIACYNAQPYLADAVKSALLQEDVSVEVLLVDDWSTDGSLAAAQKMAAADPRIRVFQTPSNGGPAAARNIALANMSGEWFAVLDSDDLVEPSRSATLIAFADRAGADLIADNLLVFGDGIEEHTHFAQPDLNEERWLELEEYFSRSCLFGPKSPPGFLKPMIRASVINRSGLRYDEDLRIGEDDELIVRILRAGYRYLLVPQVTYRYRKHPGSISHRLSLANAQRMMEAEDRIRQSLDRETARSRSYRRRWSAMKRGLAFVASIELLKQRRFAAALGTILAQPGALILYKMPIGAALARLKPSG